MKRRTLEIICQYNQVTAQDELSYPLRWNVALWRWNVVLQDRINLQYEMKCRTLRWSVEDEMSWDEVSRDEMSVPRSFHCQRDTACFLLLLLYQSREPFSARSLVEGECPLPCHVIWLGTLGIHMHPDSWLGCTILTLYSTNVLLGSQCIN